MADDEHVRLSASLEESAQRLKLPVSSVQVRQLIEFLDLLFRWNSTYNLTAIRDRAGMLTHHLVDCLAAVPPLRREMVRSGSRTVLDVGSGGGLPGVVFAVMEAGLNVACVDSVGKKVAFVQQVAASLKLPNLQARHARVEALNDVPRYDLVVSRAFASLLEFTRLTAGLLADGGSWMAMKGKIPDEEMRVLPQNIEVFHVEPLLIPEVSAERCLIWMRIK
jgi:16S rRNA (guanine527-N7)-methyltransferase